MLETDSLRRTAIFLVIATLAWNLLEAVISLWAGVVAGSVSLLAYGLDSVVEMLVGGVLVWRLLATGDGDREEAAERKARRLVGLIFFFLSAYIFFHSGASLLGWLPEPQPSLVGIVLVIASAVVMSAFYVSKMVIATRIQSRALRGEALASLFCDLQDGAILVGLGLNALFAWWWADSAAALIIVPLLIKEGMENFAGDECGNGHEDEHVQVHEAPRVCFCPNCFYGLRSCRCVACAA
ncbi:MAG: cation transporter [Chloroflexi bacterium]|nr:cation transporter [Chloroflexota bacterium]